MPLISAIFDSNASGRLIELEQEHAILLKRILDKGLDADPEATEIRKLEDLQNQYRQNFYAQFATASAFANALTSHSQFGLGLSSLMAQEAATCSRALLPISAPGVGSVFKDEKNMTTEYRDFTKILRLFSNDTEYVGPEGYVTTERLPAGVNVCLTHVPCGKGGTPTNNVEDIALILRRELRREGYIEASIKFYIHIPAGSISLKEVLAKVEFEKPESSWRLKAGHPSFAPENCLSEMPHALSQSLKFYLENSPAAENRDIETVKTNAYRNFVLGLNYSD